MEKTGLIGAMDEEIRILKEKMTEITSVKRAKNEFYTGKLGKKEIVLVKCGIGKVNAALCAQTLISEFGVTRIINTGIAGGLDKKLALFDFVISSDAVQHDFDVTAFGYPPTVIPRMDTSLFPADGELIKTAQKAFEKSDFSVKLWVGRIASGDQFIADEASKNHIAQICGKPLCVEMEGAAIAQVCHVNGIRFVIVRCISDMADDKTETFNEEKGGLLSAQLVYAMCVQESPEEKQHE